MVELGIVNVGVEMASNHRVGDVLRKADGCSTNETEANVGHTAPTTCAEQIVEVGKEIDRTYSLDTSKPLYNSW